MYSLERLPDNSWRTRILQYVSAQERRVFACLVVLVVALTADWFIIALLVYVLASYENSLELAENEILARRSVAEQNFEQFQELISEVKTE